MEKEGPMLRTIQDLHTQHANVRTQFVQAASRLSLLYDEWKHTDQGGYKYTVDIPGSEGRAAGIHASELSRCLRLLVYSIQGQERRPPVDAADINMKMRFNIGHSVHAMLQREFELMCDWVNGTNRLERTHLLFQSEVKIHPGLGGAAAEWNIHSSCDGVFTFYEVSGHEQVVQLRVGLEIKTASPGEFEKLNRPKDEHVEQTCIYMATLNLPLMWVLYYNKGNSNYTNSTPPWLLQFNQALWDKQLEPRMAKASYLAESNKIPPREEGKHCRWCPFVWVCAPTCLAKRGPHRSTVAP